jgi:5-methylcytosine-specific restriction protein B
MMAVEQAVVERIIELVRVVYPGWEDFDDPRLHKDELDYKRQTVELAAELLGAERLSELLEAGDTGEFIESLERVGRDNNLLYNAVPSRGDLNILYAENLDEAAFCRAVFELLHGEEPVGERLGTYLDYVRSHELPDKWTFSTYFLFFTQPESELYIKPLAVKRFLELIDRAELWDSNPNADSYLKLRGLAHELRAAFADRGARDILDVQSLIWVCRLADDQLQQPLVSSERAEEFTELLARFTAEYPRESGFAQHRRLYEEGRRRGRENWERVLKAREAGKEYTDLVLEDLLPPFDSKANRERDAWISVAPVSRSDLRGWFESLGWVEAGDWPRVAEAVVGFVERCLSGPDELDAACREFAELDFIKGMQAGFLSPILNALEPERFLLVNSKSCRLIDHFCGTRLTTTLTDYPELNELGLRILDELGGELELAAAPELGPGEVLDMFAHWLVAVYGYAFREVDYWKLAPGREAVYWKDWVAGNYISIGWPELGDIGGVLKREFDERRDEVVEHSEETKAGLEQAWHFSQLKPGDRIVANKGTTELLGLGTVSGPYYFADGEEYPHRLPVVWDDLTRRRIDETGWRRPLVKLDAEKFRRLSQAPPLEEDKMTTSTEKTTEGLFSRETFELLAALHEDPTKDFYQAHRDGFAEYVEEPFKRLFALVAERLPEPMTELLETEKRILARILKNDYGRGGAWDYLWGAFYPAGSRRIADAQLYIVINRNAVAWGFYVGEYGEESGERFLRNCRRHRRALPGLLRDSLKREGLTVAELLYGDEAEEEALRRAELFDDPVALASNPELDAWLDEPVTHGLNVSLGSGRDGVLAQGAAELAERIAAAYRALFPLVLLTVEEDPLPAIREFLGAGEEEEPEIQPPYPLEQLAAESGFSRELLERWKRAVERKGQAILYGPPGTGKTYIARRLARHLVGGGDGFHELVQFHPAYAYEDFIQGIRPETTADGGLNYKLVSGRFLEFCRRAARRKGTCVLIIDEINRANLARVLGELMYLLEYREQAVPLAGGNKPFKIPGNVRLLGTMNTADRSIALVDHALRRRFAFLRLQPDYAVLRRYHEREETGFDTRRLEAVLQKLNKAVGDSHYEVGITFFLRPDIADQLEDIWRMEIEPYLEEFFFDQPSRVEAFRWKSIHEEIQ